MRSRSSLFIGVLASVVFLANQARASDIPERDSVPGVSSSAETARFDLYQGYFIVVHGSIGPLKNLNFFLDTGTSPAVVDSGIARKLNLQEGGPASIVVVGGRTAGEEARLPSLEIGPVKQTNLRVITADLSFFQRTLPVRIDGIVGLDVLGKQGPFAIDYPARVIRFGPAEPLAVSLPLHLDRGLAVFDAEIDHKPVHLLFDTGTYSLILFSRATGQSPESTIAVREENRVWLRTLRMGAEEFRQKPALMAHNPKPSQLDFDGLMSPAALGISRVSVDLKGGVLAFSR